MSKLDNYIYYSICEKSYELFQETNFMTYRMFCFSFKNSIVLNDLGNKELRIIDEIYSYLRLIYGLDYNTAFEYIGEYFLDDMCIKFEEPVRLVRDYFKNSFS